MERGMEQWTMSVVNGAMEEWSNGVQWIMECPLRMERVMEDTVTCDGHRYAFHYSEWSNGVQWIMECPLRMERVSIIWIEIPSQNPGPPGAGAGAPPWFSNPSKGGTPQAPGSK